MVLNKIFYPEVIIKLLEEPKEKTLIEFDDGTIGYIKFNKEEFNYEEFFKKLAEIKLNDNLINKKLKDIKKNKEIKKEIRKEVYEENPELKNISPDEEDYDEKLEELNEKIEEKINNKAKEIALKDTTIKKGSIIKLAGITSKDENDNIILNSKSILTDENGNPISSGTGIYNFAVINRKTPIEIIQSKNKKPKIRLSKLINKNQFKIYVHNQLETFKAFGQEEIKLRKKTYKLTKLPKPYIYLNKKYENIFKNELLKEVVSIINTDIERIKEKELSSNLKNNLKELYKDDFEINNDIDKYYFSFKYLKDFILTNMEDKENTNIFNYINIYLPLGISEEDYKNILNIVLNGNKSGKEGRLGIIESLLNTTFTKYKDKYKDEIIRLIKDKFEELYEDSKLVLETTYTPETNTFVGFFPENINTKNSVLSITNYSEIIKEINNKIIFNKDNK